MALILGTHAVKVSSASWLKNKNESQQFYCNKNKNQAPIVI